MILNKKISRPLTIGLVIGCFSAGLFLIGALKSWSDFATDRFFVSQTADSSVVIVAIDDKSISQIGRWPWDRNIHARIIDKLTEAGVSAVGYDVIFPETSNLEDDLALETALKRAGNVVLPIELTVAKERSGYVYDPKRAITSIPTINAAAKASGHTNTPPDTDGVFRRAPILVQAPDGTTLAAFAVQILRLVKPDYAFTAVPVNKSKELIVNFSGPPQQTYTTYSAVDVYRGLVEPTKLNGKTVFVGSTAADLHDDRLVPVSNGAPMPGVEIHASIYSTLKTENWLVPVPRGFQALLLVLLGLIAAVLVISLRARSSSLAIFLVWIGWLVAAFIAFDFGHILGIVWPTITLIFASAAVTLERRVTSDRERRELRSAFSHYVSDSVVNEIMRKPEKLKLGGEKRTLTVLFSDVRGFTSIAEKMSPEKLVEVMNLYLTRMTEMVFQTEGVLDKYIGDAVMAFWNAPLDQPDHAFRAVKTALLMQDELKKMNQADVFSNGLKLKIGIGINTGEMIVGNMGSDTRFDYTVIGDNVNLASRVEGITKEYGVGILATESVMSKIKDQIVARRIDKVAVKGKKEPVMIYEVLGLKGLTEPKLLSLASDFEAALEAYFAQSFTDSMLTCESILKNWPEDGPTLNLLSRCQQFKISAPPANWDGTWVYTKK